MDRGGTSRRAKWWYSTFHIVTAMIGAGVLSLPYAMAYLGWYILDSTKLNLYKFSYLEARALTSALLKYKKFTILHILP